VLRFFIFFLKFCQQF